MPFAPGELIVTFRSGFTIEEITKFLEERQMKMIMPLPATPENSITCLVRVPKGSEIEWTLKLQKHQHPDVASVGPNRYIELA